MTINANSGSNAKTRRPLSLRNRLLIAFLLLASLPVLITAITSTYISTQGLRQEVFSRLEGTAQLKESEVKSWLSSLQVNLDLVLKDKTTLQDALTVLQTPDESAVARVELQRKFNELNKSTGYFEELFILDKNGTIVLSTNNLQEGKISKTQSYFHEGINGPYIAPPAYDVALSGYSIIFSQPIKNEFNQTVGVIAGRANLAVLSQIMGERTALGETGETYLVSSNYAALTELRFKEANIGETYVRTQGTTNVLGSQAPGSALYPDYRGVSVLGAYRWIPELQVAIIAESDESEALRSANTVFAITLGLMALVVVIAVGVAFLVTRSVVAPISQLVTVAESVSAGSFDVSASVQRDDEIGVLAAAFNTMTSRLRDLIGSLEQRVAERTRALSSVAEVGTAASSTLETDKLLQQVVDLAKERFNFYHAHIYLLNEAGDTLVLASGAGEPGRQMVAEGRSIALDREQSLVARAAREKKGVTVNDVTQEADFLPNPLLPETHAELAVPMIVGEQVIGVFDVQSEFVGRFTDADIAVQTTLASQLASAVQNARSFERAEESIRQLDAQKYALDQHSIVAITDVTGKITYVNDKFVEISKYSREELIGQDHRILNSGYHPKEFIRNLWVTIANGKVFHAEIKNKAKDGSLYWVETTIVPFLNEQGKPYQYLAIRTDITKRKNDEEALAKRAQQQEAINLIARQIQNATTVEQAMQVAARELGHALGQKPTAVSLDVDTLPTKDHS